MNRFFRLSLATLLSFFIWYAGDAQGIVVEHTQTVDAEAQINHALAALPMTFTLPTSHLIGNVKY